MSNIKDRKTSVQSIDPTQCYLTNRALLPTHNVQYRGTEQNKTGEYINRIIYSTALRTTHNIKYSTAKTVHYITLQYRRV